MEIPRKVRATSILGIVIVLVVLLGLIELNEVTFRNPEQLRDFILQAGGFIPLTFVLLHIVQVFFPVIPGAFFAVVAGYLFGPVLGTVYTLIGVLFGSSMAFFLSRKAGEKILNLFISRERLKAIEAFFAKKKRLALFLARIIPLAPNNVVCFYAGMTGITYPFFLLMSFIGFAPYIILYAFLGSELAQLITLRVVLVLLIVFGLMALGYQLWLHKRGKTYA